MNCKLVGSMGQKLTMTLCLVFSLVACSKLIWINPSGNINSKIEFFFYEDSEKKKVAVLDIDQIVVQKKTPGDQWNIVWHLEGSESLSSVIYGSDYGRFSVVKQAEKLESGKSYRMLVNASEASGAILFYINEKGDAEVVHEAPVLE